MSDRDLYDRRSCAALVITCADFRFKAVEQEFVLAAGLVDDFDLIARPGGIRSLVSPRSDAARESMLEEIDLLWKAHGFLRALLLSHLSCRAYDDLVGEGDGRALHLAHLREAASLIEERLQGVAAEAHLIALVDGALRVEPVARG